MGSNDQKDYLGAAEPLKAAGNIENEAKKAKKVDRKKAKAWYFSKCLYDIGSFVCLPGVLENKHKNRKSYDVKKIYWDVDGNLRQGLSHRSRDEELLQIIEDDDGNDEDPSQVWMIIPSRWVRDWLLFTHLKLNSTPPGPIDVGVLIKQDEGVEGGWRPKNTLQPPSRNKIDTGDYSKPEFDVKPGHYRRVPLDVWKGLVSLYGLTEPQFCIAVKGNTRDTPASNLSRWRIFQSPTGVVEGDLPEPTVVNAEEAKKEIEHKRRLFAAMGLT